MLAIYSPNHEKKCCWTKVLIFCPFGTQEDPEKGQKFSFVIFSARRFISSGIICLPKYQKNFWTGFFILGPVCDLGPETCPKWPKTKNRTSLSVFHPGFSSFQYVISFSRQKILLDRNFDLGPQSIVLMVQKLPKKLKI